MPQTTTAEQAKRAVDWMGTILDDEVKTAQKFGYIDECPLSGIAVKRLNDGRPYIVLTTQDNQDLHFVFNESGIVSGQLQREEPRRQVA